MDEQIKKPTKTRTKQRVSVPGSRKQLLKLTVAEEGTLLPFLIASLSDKSRTTIKQLLHDRFISVNGTPTTQFDTPLSGGDVVCLHPAPLPSRLVHPQIDIIYQDEYLIIVRKATGIPTVASGEEKDKTVLRLLSEHLKAFNPQAKVYHITRLDKDSAGFVVFTKSRELQTRLSEDWQRYCRRQQFAVVTERQPEPSEGVLVPASDTKAREEHRRRGDTRRTGDAHEAGRATYRTLATGDTRSLLSVELTSGRNNRLRRQLAALHCPIVGDWRNGSTEKELGYVALESIHLSLEHPVTGELLDFSQPVPSSFRRLLRTKMSPRDVKRAKAQPKRGR
jgi:Pseudouridylate synthases, 23S RNA-specific